MDQEKDIEQGERQELQETGSLSSNEKKGKILDAAERLFGEMGFEAVSTRLLAKEAGVNMAMLAYYFGSKEKLFESMITRRIQEGKVKLAVIVDSDASPQDKIKLIIDQYVDKLFSGKRMHAIFSREISLDQRSVVSEMICGSYHTNIMAITRVIIQGEELGVFRKVDREMTIVMMMSTISNVLNFQAMSRLVFDIPAGEKIHDRDDVKERVKKHLKDVLLSYLSTNQNL